MKMSEAFPSKYLKAADLQGKQARVVMDRVDEEQVGNNPNEDPKPILYFVGKEKGMVLNKTNAGNIADTYGDDSEDWHGEEIILFEAMVDFQGRTVPAIRVRVPRPSEKRKPATVRPKQQARDEQYDEANPPPHGNMAAALDDEIPFEHSWK